MPPKAPASAPASQKQLAVDYEFRIRAASTAALRALSTPTHATGTPGGICADRQQRVEAAGHRCTARQRHPDHGQVTVRRDDPGERSGQAGAGDDHSQPAQPRIARVVGNRVGLAVGGHHPDLGADPTLGELLLGGLHRRHVAL